MCHAARLGILIWMDEQHVQEAREMTLRAVSLLEEAWALLEGEGRVPSQRDQPWDQETLRENELLGFLSGASENLGTLKQFLLQPDFGREAAKYAAQHAQRATESLRAIERVLHDEIEMNVNQLFFRELGRSVQAEDNVIAHYPRWFWLLGSARHALESVANLLKPYSR